MSQEPEHIPDEDRIAELLRAVDSDLAPPDPEFLDALRLRSLDVFLAASEAPELDRPTVEVDPTAAEKNTLTSPPAPAVRNWRQFMLAFALRGSLAASAALVMFAAWLASFPGNPVIAAVPFSEVIDELRQAKSLHLEVVKDGQATEVWVRSPGLVRMEDSPQRYRIAAGSRLWRIDEAANTVAESDSPWFLDPEQPVDLLGLMELGIRDASSLLTAKPIKQTIHDGKNCLLYRVDLPATEGRVEIEALADADTKQFVAFLARRAGKGNDNAPGNAAGNAGGQVNLNPPLAEMKLIAMNVAVADDKFVVTKSLTEDGRIGTIRNPQGIVVLRPMLSKRWTPLCRETALKPGDWIRTDLRGANAVKVVLSSDTVLTLGPGSQLECLSPTQARLHSGEVQVALTSKTPTPFELLAPRQVGHRKFVAEGKTLVLVDRNENLVDIPKQPQWLAGFEGTSANESIGSLIVKLPDGRNEPLTVGYHKVSVEIRDQIARTTIEESFVNHTIGRLEGIFHFPLPQDASISGFGMWIGNDLIEADVVEKQRAREIYETILRENRDPGLLEWTGGNIFKARVFPIEPRSEKRVKIVYTQVLPLRGNRYRYSYGLRSELLRTKPLRELSINLTVNSALPLKDISCPTHPVRKQLTAHSGQVEFAAQEYSPTRDFEVVCDIDGKQSDVVVIPHRRGDDGYLLVQVTPPAPEGNFSRELLPEGKPLQLVLLCDTSSSMDVEKRKQQAEFVATVLSSLGENDRFSLVAADVSPVWAAAEPMAPKADNVAKAQKFLADRVSLGWTDLDRAFADIVRKAPAGAQIIYIGDGIVTAGDSDPAAFVNRLGRLVNGQGPPAANHARRGFHAVSLGNSHESVVLKGIAAMGGGSARSISGEQTPQTVALELLNEIAQPGLRDLKVEFKGLKVAAVYPDRLPNLAAGTQQILVGRYLPEGKDQQGEIIVTGKRGTETVKYAAKVSLKDAEAGNSFIPRLWARSYLDQLLQQGSSASIRDDIIRLSEEFHIITPYTSLLVLETDADRERFGVQRRYEMRDGERFFAEGRANSNFELLQQQMKVAGNWRLGLRRQVLRSLASLGRNPALFQRQRQEALVRTRSLASFDTFDFTSDDFGAVNGPQSEVTKSLSKMQFQEGEESLMQLGDFDGLSVLSEMPAGSGGFGGGGFGRGDSAEDSLVVMSDKAYDEGPFSGEKRERTAWDTEVAAKDRLSADTLGLGMAIDDEPDGFKELDWAGLEDPDGSRGGRRQRFDLKANEPAAATPALFTKRKAASPRGLDVSNEVFGFRFAGGRRGRGSPDYHSWLNTLFPPLAPWHQPPVKPVKDPETWSPEALALSRSLLRIDSLRKLEGGIELRRIAETFDPRWNRRDSRNLDLTLYSPTAWLTRSLNPGTSVNIEFCNAKERGIFSSALLLGRVRASHKEELLSPPLGLYDLSLSPLHETMPSHVARVEPAGENLVKLILTHQDSTYEQHYTIDTAKHVLVKAENFDEGKSTGTTVYSDFVQVAGTWWARKSVVTDAKGQKIGENSWDVTALPQDTYQQRMNAELVSLPKVQFIHFPGVTLKVARQKVADASAGFDDRLLMILHFAGLQQWDDLLKQVDAIEKLAADKPGVRWIRPIILATIRRNDEARQWMLAEAHRLVAGKNPDELYFADFILGQVYGITSWSEFLEFVESLKPIYERQPAELEAMPRWQDRLASCYEQLNRHEEALAIRKALAERTPWNLYAQIEFARRLRSVGQTDASLAWLQRELDRKIERNASESESLNSAFIEFYRAVARWEDLLGFTSKWIERNPESRTAYGERLSALIFNNQLDAANALVEQWLKEARIEGKLTPVAHAKMDAALNFAVGQIPHLYVQRIQERWVEPLAKTARFFLRHKHHFEFAERVMGNNYHFSQFETCDQLRGEFLGILQTDADKLTPRLLSVMVPWCLSGRMELPQPVNGRKQLDASEIDIAVWKKIAATIHTRWAQTQDKRDKYPLGATLISIYSNRFRDTEYLPFLRERNGSAPAEVKQQYIRALFDALLAAEWTEAIEQEAFARLRELSDEKEPVDRLQTLIPALQQYVDRMIEGRKAVAEKQLQDLGETNKLTRQELAKKRGEIKQAAQTGVVARLVAEAAKEQHAAFAAWIRIERSWLDVQLAQNLDAVEAECWKLLGEAPPKPEADDADEDRAGPKPTLVELKQEYFDALLRGRAFSTVMHLAMRRSAPPASVAKLLKFVDTGMSYGGDVAATWRLTKFRLLVGLDRPEDLEKELREWVRIDTSTSPWRMMLARLLAERGKIEEAIPLFEACEKDKLLTGADYRTLADWYLVLNRRDSYERARIEAYKQTPENQLSNMMYQIRNHWNQRNVPLPSELDENTLFAWRALFEKSGQPQNYLWQLRELYGASRDFRLLQMLPDAALGRTPQQAYPFIIQIQTQILYEMRNEATADEIISRIKKLREGERTPTDLRALDLLEAVVERKSSEVLNQPGPHVDACVAAMQRAFQRKFAEGEPVHMAQFLRDLGTLHHPRLVEEQLRELRELLKLAPPGSRDHLQIMDDYCHVLFWDYHRQNDALREMEAEVTAYDRIHEGRWPNQDNDVLGSYVGLFEGAKRHADGESVLQKYIARPENAEQRKWLTDRLLATYNSALHNEGTVSLGTGQELFNNLVARFLKEIDQSPDENVRHNEVTRLVGTFEIGRQKKFSTVAPAVSKFAFELLPQLLKRQQGQYRNTTLAPMQVIHDVLGPREALRYIVERMEQYPPWLEMDWNNSWNTFSQELGRRRHEAAEAKLDLQDLEARTLKLVLNELRRDLRTGENRNRHIYHIHYVYYWKEKALDFARVANEVFAERKSSGRRAMTVARYLWEGLGLHPRAIEIMFLAHKDGLLEVSSQAELVNWLQSEGRFGESIPLLELFVVQYPDSMHYRAQLMTAYFRSQRPEQLQELVVHTDKHFHGKGRWSEANISMFAQVCRECGLTERSIGYYNEAVALHQRSHPGSGLGDLALSNLYRELAHAHSTLGHTKEAVEMASAAIICWHARHEQRTIALQALTQVLSEAKDLDAYVKHLDQQAADTKQDSPLLRKAIGQIYQGRQQWDLAIAQLRIALTLQPNDKDVHKSLMACFDAGDPAKYKGQAVQQLLALIDLERHDLTLYQQLAERLKNDEAEAERAATSIIEAAPNESESHTALAEWRQKQDRWGEAIPHWEQVAKLRRLEPTGLLKLTAAQLHQKQWDAAKKSIEALQKTEWPTRFGDVRNEAQNLKNQLPK